MIEIYYEISSTIDDYLQSDAELLIIHDVTSPSFDGDSPALLLSRLPLLLLHDIYMTLTRENTINYDRVALYTALPTLISHTAGTLFSIAKRQHEDHANTKLY